MPLAYWLCFPMRWGVSGIWVGLTVALILIGVWLVLVWRYRLTDQKLQSTLV
jgi:Na+-driven multidrug efflux pump